VEWEVEFADEFRHWWDNLSEAEQEDVNDEHLRALMKEGESHG
jgi:hypothetical protein